jgi:hypothetical protein
MPDEINGSFRARFKRLGERGLIVHEKKKYYTVPEDAWRAFRLNDIPRSARSQIESGAVVAHEGQQTFINMDRLQFTDEPKKDVNVAGQYDANADDLVLHENGKCYRIPRAEWTKAELPFGAQSVAGALVKRGTILAMIPNETDIPIGTYCTLINLEAIAGK